MEKILIPWIIEIKGLMTEMRVGDPDIERGFQPICIDVSISARASAFPESIDDCLNYQPICRWIVEELSKKPHTHRLETRALDLLRFIFDFDARAERVEVSMSGLGPFAGTCKASRVTRSRDEHEPSVMAATSQDALWRQHVLAH